MYFADKIVSSEMPLLLFTIEESTADCALFIKEYHVAVGCWPPWGMEYLQVNVTLLPSNTILSCGCDVISEIIHYVKILFVKYVTALEVFWGVFEIIILQAF